VCTDENNEVNLFGPQRLLFIGYGLGCFVGSIATFFCSVSHDECLTRKINVNDSKNNRFSYMSSLVFIVNKKKLKLI